MRSGGVRTRHVFCFMWCRPTPDLAKHRVCMPRRWRRVGRVSGRPCMTTESSSTKKCPDCAEDVMIGAGFCPYCGYSFAAESAPVQEKEEVPAPPPPPSPASAPMAAPRASAPVGEMREGIVGSARTRLGEVVLGLSVAAMVLTALFSAADIGALAWAQRSDGLLAKPALGYTSGAVITAVVAAFGIRVPCHASGMSVRQ